MAYVIDINNEKKFGSRGSGVLQFDYPEGMCYVTANNSLYVVDKQNHRICIYDQAGNYKSSFGSLGTGSSNFKFPEFICSDETYLYITDSANHRVKIYDLTGTLVSTFGSRGSGNGQFNYPVGICYSGTYLYVVDKQNNRVQYFQTDGTYEGQWGSLGTTDDYFKLPEGCAYINDRIAVVDSGNDVLKIFETTGVFIAKTTESLSYAIGVSNTNGVLCLVDRQGSQLYFYDENLELIREFGSYGTGMNEFNFPIGAASSLDRLFISDSASHQIKIFFYNVENGLAYNQSLLRLTKQLYPTGRAWWMRINGVFEQLHDALARSESRAYESMINIQDAVIADNIGFDETAATEWERNLGMRPSTEDLEVRKQAILRKQAYPNGCYARQHYRFIEKQLQDAGFSCFIHENRFWDGSKYITVDPLTFASMDMEFGVLEFGNNWEFGGTIPGINYTELIGNYIDETKDADILTNIPNNEFGQAEFGVWEFGYNYSYEDGLKATFFVMGAGFPSMCDIPLSRKKEFRELLLRIKPAQMVGYLYVNYI